MRLTDTIYALSSAHGRAGVAVVRVSGPAAQAAVKALTGKDNIPSRAAVLLPLRGPGGEIIDRALTLWFAAPASYTGEDVAEFQLHGGRAILEAVFAALSAVSGVRPAEPGEFTRRAVENGRLDLTRAEAVADLIDAETEAQRRQAIRQYDGQLFALYENWRDRLTHSLAHIEACIDFSDEELPENALAEARGDVGNLLREIEAHLDDRHRGEIVREGLRVAVIGPPNAGKSSLVNALARREVAIVSPTPGTTRDIIEVRLNLGGYAVVLADTAGLREPGGEVEAEGVKRALNMAEEAGLVLLLQDGSGAVNPVNMSDNMVNKSLLEVWNKADLAWNAPHDGFRISAKTGEGLDRLVEAIADFAKNRLAGDDAAPTRPRHRHALLEAADSLRRAGKSEEIELIAEDVRLALRALGRITGAVDVEDVLDVIFRDFCIGK
jgi:tRNA modification GTPase